MPQESTVRVIDLAKLTRWTFDGGMFAAVAKEGQWVSYTDLHAGRADHAADGLTQAERLVEFALGYRVMRPEAPDEEISARFNELSRDRVTGAARQTSASNSSSTCAADAEDVPLSFRDRFADAYKSLSVAHFNGPFWNQSMEELLTAVDAEIDKRVAERLALSGQSKNGADAHAKTLTDLLACFLSWESQVCVLGNVRAGDAAEAIKDALERRATPRDEQWLDNLREAVSQFRKAVFEFARGQDPKDHAAMLQWQREIFRLAKSESIQRPDEEVDYDDLARQLLSESDARDMIGRCTRLEPDDDLFSLCYRAAAYALEHGTPTRSAQDTLILEVCSVIENVIEGAKTWPGGWSGTVSQLEKALRMLGVFQQVAVVHAAGDGSQLPAAFSTKYMRGLARILRSDDEQRKSNFWVTAHDAADYLTKIADHLDRAQHPVKDGVGEQAAFEAWFKHSRGISGDLERRGEAYRSGEAQAARGDWCRALAFALLHRSQEVEHSPGECKHEQHPNNASDSN